MDDRSTDPGRARREIRAGLLDNGPAPAGLADGVSASWQRSSQYGLKPERAVTDAVLEHSQVKQLRERNERLITFALPELENLYQQIVGTNSAVLLADPGGVILERQGDPHFSERSQRVALQPGACWGEQARGTNAIGLALSEGRSASVHGAEHFLDCNTFLTCAATPIYGADQTVVGLLDVSGDQPARQLHALGLVRMGARMIENRMLVAEYPEAYYFHLHARAELLGTLGEGIIAVNEEGRLLAMNAVAQSHFAGASRQTSFQSLFSQSLDEALRVLHNGGLLRTSSGLNVHARAVEPRRMPRVAGVVAQRRPSAKADAFAALHAGDARTSQLMDRGQRVFNQQIPLLLAGETGTGKEWAARALHAQSPRHEGPLISVNCAAIPDALAEAELFGYRPGAFTGASTEGAPGYILQANGGTLFLDEVGDMPLTLQSRLLRVLQERAVTPVGGTEPVEVDFSLISATHHDLETLVSEGRFRADLYYRVCGHCIELPPLRARADLSGLIDRFLAEDGRDAQLSADARQCLLNYPWPGNLRELHNVLRTALALRVPDGRIQLHDLPEAIQSSRPRARGSLPSAAGDLRALEVRHMSETLAACHGNYSAAARVLGVSRSTLYRRLRDSASDGGAA